MEPTNAVWLGLLTKILDDGWNVRPRDYLTKELLGVQTRVNMANPVVTVGARNLGYKFMPAESAWILSGDNRVDTIRQYSKHIVNFSDDGLTFYGAYGPRFVDQSNYIVRTLATDPASRQAVLTFWRERPGVTVDCPCTVALQFIVRRQKFHCIATMRSSDAWLGWPYDVHTFSMIAAYLLLALRRTGTVKPKYAIEEKMDWSTVRLGELILTAGSQHLYERDWILAANTCFVKGHDTSAFTLRPLELDQFDTPQSLIDHLWAVARDGKREGWLAELPI